MTRFAALLALAVSLAPGQLAAQPTPPNPDIINTTETFRQSEAVKKRYGDVKVDLAAPSLKPGVTGFTSHEQMMTFLKDTVAGNQRAALISAGASQQGREIPLLLFTAEGDRALSTAASRTDRPVVWFIGLQHGNEPAGGEAMLALAAELARPEAAALLSKVTVVIVPRANPDGAASFERATANKADLNRDHLLLFLPEARALHRALRDLPPDVVFDHHEFSVANRWIDKFGMLQAADALFLQATHPLVPKEISSLAEQLFRPAVDKALAAHDLTGFWYYTTSNRKSDLVVSMGGNNPGIARNALGLAGAVSFLIETRGVGIEREGWQRRVATHVLAARAVLAAAAGEGPKLKQAIDTGRKAAASATAPLVVAATIPANDLAIPLIHPETAEKKNVTVKFQDSRRIEPTVTRPRAAGYVLTGQQAGAVERLRLNGVVTCKLAMGAEIAVEAYALT
ncbi:MAG: M14 family zinc carboxypeptidase, partial [Beijerinckiaceae bacterium]